MSMHLNEYLHCGSKIMEAMTMMTHTLIIGIASIILLPHTVTAQRLAQVAKVTHHKEGIPDEVCEVQRFFLLREKSHACTREKRRYTWILRLACMAPSSRSS